MPRILIVDDDPYLRELLEVTLQSAGFETVQACTGRKAWDVLAETKVDLVLLDVMMPETDGWTLCEQIRESWSLPIMMVTALGDVSQKVRGFSLGADDYITKPFAGEELIARIQAVLRRFHINTHQELTIGTAHLDARTHQVTLAGRDIPLPPKEFLLLYHLARYSGQTLLRENLLEEVWGYDYEGDERTLDVHIKRLRDKFPVEPAQFSIRTIRGLGYRLEVTS